MSRRLQRVALRKLELSQRAGRERRALQDALETLQRPINVADRVPPVAATYARIPLSPGLRRRSLRLAQHAYSGARQLTELSPMRCLQAWVERW